MSSSNSPVPSSSLLSYPSPSEDNNPSPSHKTESRNRELLQDRLYIGNLHPSVTEHTLIQVFSKFGPLSNLDFLFHKSGALKGKPRGYAFVQYSSAADAENALSNANEKLLRGRHLVVTHAHQAPLDAPSNMPRRIVNEAGRPTALSLLKSTGGRDRTRDKIALLEAKLRQLEEVPTPGVSPSISTPPSSVHPSLPPRPAASASLSHASPLTSAHSTPSAMHTSGASKGAPSSSTSSTLVRPRDSLSSHASQGSSFALDMKASSGPRKHMATLKGVKLVKKGKGKASQDPVSVDGVQ